MPSTRYRLRERSATERGDLTRNSTLFFKNYTMLYLFPTRSFVYYLFYIIYLSLFPDAKLQRVLSWSTEVAFAVNFFREA